MPGSKKSKQNTARATKMQQRKQRQRSGGPGDALKFGLYVKRMQDVKLSKNLMCPKTIEGRIKGEMNSYNSMQCIAATGKSMSMCGMDIVIKG